MAAKKPNAPLFGRKTDDRDASDADEIEGRLLQWRDRDTDRTALDDAGEPEKRLAVERVLSQIVHFRQTVLPARGGRDGGRPADGAGSGWGRSAGQPKPKGTGKPAVDELAAWEALLRAGGFTDAQTADLTDPGGDGAARVEQRRRRRRERLSAEGRGVS